MDLPNSLWWRSSRLRLRSYAACSWGVRWRCCKVPFSAGSGVFANPDAGNRAAGIVLVWRDGGVRSAALVSSLPNATHQLRSSSNCSMNCQLQS